MPLSQNLLLRSLSAEALAALGPAERIDLPLKTKVHEDGHAYFLESGIASIVTSAGGSEALEWGLIGSEGTSALSVIYQDTESPFHMYVQVAGTASRFDSSRLYELIDERPEVRALMLRFARAFSIQVSTTAFANGRSKIDARLARWILMASDRVGPTFDITHEILSMMLGVRRSGVTIAMQDLEGRGYIHAQRGTTSVRDRAGLIEATAGAYGFSEAHYERLLGPRALPFYQPEVAEFVDPVAA